MAKIKIEVDSDSTQQPQGAAAQFATGTKIGVVSSIKFDGKAFETRFKKGVGAQFNVKSKHNANYKKNDRSALETHVIYFNGAADLIATVGGSVSYKAAVDRATKPFVSLTGSVPDAPPDLYRGGVSLESYDTNSERIQALTDKGLAANEIGLFYNPNSQMSPDEVPDWNFQIGANNQIFAGGNDNNGNNSNATFAADFARISAGIRGLVISADPYFQDNKEQLIVVANGWLAAAANRYVCYPSLDFVNKGGTRPTSRSLLCGPDLATAYFLLGQLAATALTSGQRGPTVRLSNVLQEL